MRLTIGVKPEEGREKKKKVPNEGVESSKDKEVEQQVSHLRRHVVEMGEGEVELNWYPHSPR